MTNSEEPSTETTEPGAPRGRLAVSSNLPTTRGGMSLRAKAAWAVLFFLLLLGIASDSIVMIAIEEDIGTASVVARYVAIISLLLVAVLFATMHMGAWIAVPYAALSGAVSLYSLKLNFLAIVVSLPRIIYFGAVGVTAFAMGVLAYLIARSQKGPGWRVFIVPVALIVTPIFIHVTDDGADDRNTSPNEFPDWQQVTLRQKPNIYLFGFDSLAPPKLLNEYLGIEKLAYQDQFQTILATVEPAISPQVPTMYSLNSVMRLDQKRQVMSRGFFAGRRPSILGRLLHANGYRIRTGYSSSYFGNAGTYVDEYISPSDLNLNATVICIDRGKSFRLRSRAFFACSGHNWTKTRSHLLFKALFGGKPPSAEDNSFGSGNWNKGPGPHLRDPWLRLLLSHVQAPGSGEAPRFSYVHTYRPIGHTPKAYDHNDPVMRADFRDYYVSGAIQLSSYLRDLQKAVLRRDPNAIVFIFGDHGPFINDISRSESDPLHYYRGRHRILLGILRTENACSDQFERRFTRSYATASRLLMDVFICLGADRRQLEELGEFDEDPEVLRYALQ